MKTDKHLQSLWKAPKNYPHTAVGYRPCNYLQLAEIAHIQFIAINANQVIYMHLCFAL